MYHKVHDVSPYILWCVAFIHLLNLIQWTNFSRPEPIFKAKAVDQSANTWLCRVQITVSSPTELKSLCLKRWWSNVVYKFSCWRLTYVCHINFGYHSFMMKTVLICGCWLLFSYPVNQSSIANFIKGIVYPQQIVEGKALNNSHQPAFLND